MKSITYISDSGMIIQFNKSFPFFITFADLNSVDASFDEFIPTGMDGTFTQGGTYNKKIIVIEGNIVGTSLKHIESLRSKLSMAMNIHFEGTLVVEQYSGEKKKIRCRPNKNPDFSKPLGLGQPFVIELTCDSPYWLDYGMTIVPIGQIIPQWQFPFTPPVLFGYAVSNTKINNETSIEIPLKIEVLSQATMIEIKNKTNNQAFTVNVIIEENQKMIIDGNTCEVKILNIKTGERVNATNKLVAGSDFITLSPGVNDIELTNGIADGAPLSYIFYNIPSLGV